jgi:hypothetical protein
MDRDIQPAAIPDPRTPHTLPVARGRGVNLLFYGIAAGVIAGLLVHVVWRDLELQVFEQRLRSAGVPSNWFDSPKARAGLIDPNLFNVFKTGLGCDAFFWPLAGVTIAWFWNRPSSARRRAPFVIWAACVMAFGAFSVIRTDAQFQEIMEREVQRKLQAVNEWEKRKASEADTHAPGQ